MADAADPPITAAQHSSDAPIRIIDPASHIRALHAGAYCHRVTLASSVNGWTERAYGVPTAIEAVGAMAGQIDTYISYQSFFGRRRIAKAPLQGP
ncbi:MAG TPA: hypothetical protein VL100_03695, partial [Croceibacterium sp.]|nr:hypothetical protein [Croceibacterium sp.]